MDVTAIEQDLDEFQRRWLRACAVYPVLRWPLTVHLGRRLAEADGSAAPDLGIHVPLARLDWFRIGQIPADVRVKLVAEMDAAERARVRRIYDDVLRDPDRDVPTNLDADQDDDPLFAQFMLGEVLSEPEHALNVRLRDRRGRRGVARFDARSRLGLGLGLLAAAVLGIAAFLMLALNRPAFVAQSIDFEHKGKFSECPGCPEMVMLRGDVFVMGSPPDEKGRFESESPRHEVAVSAFALARTEVTFDQWDACVADGGCNENEPDDEGWDRGSRPVINVSWEDAQTYVDWLNRRVEGVNIYRLPTEAEWEYAARAGEPTAYPWGQEASHEFANYGKDECCDGLATGSDRWEFTAPAGSFAANGFDLSDMHGNVYEWVADCWFDDYQEAPQDGAARAEGSGKDCALRVVRGGSWVNYPQLLRSAFRVRLGPGDRSNGGIGFRPARTLTP